MKYIYLALIAALFALGGCAHEYLDAPEPEIPDEEYICFEPRFSIVGETIHRTRAGEDIIHNLEDVHVLVFDGSGATETGGVWTLPDNAAVTLLRHFPQYDVNDRKIYLRRGDSHFIYVMANLDERYIPGGDVEAYLGNVATYGDLKELYVQAINYSADEVGKMVMSTLDVIPITLPGGGDVFTPVIPLERLRSQFTVNVYNKTDAAGNISSGVYPSTLSFVDVPRHGYVVERPMLADPTVVAGNHDKAFSEGSDGAGYYVSTTNLMPEPSAPEQITVISAKTGEQETNYYTRQQLTFYCLENRRGTVSDQDLEDWVLDHPDGDRELPLIYARRALAPRLSTYVTLTSLTEGNILQTYFYAGQGRDYEETIPGSPEAFGNYDVERSCIYHFNVYINGTDDVTVDSRREFLNRELMINVSDDFDRLDAHYMDVPVYVQGRTQGWFEMEAGVMDGPNWRAMSELPSGEQWLTLSWRDPYPGDANVSTAVGGALNVGPGGLAEAMPIFHIAEYVNAEATGSYPAAVVPALEHLADPPRRTASVRVGFVSGATSQVEYEAGTKSYFNFEVSQYGLKTIGPLGGYIEEKGYTKLLGVESVEEYRTRYYLQGDNPDIVRAGLPWRYIYGSGAGSAEGQFAYDGFGATRYRYGEYRRSNNYPGDVPPVRGEENTAPVTAPYPALVYNPYSNTNAVDYCVRKNRDSNGNGIIDGDELKWYLPTPMQATRMFNFRNSFRGGQWTLNRGYEPFGRLSPYYWTTAEDSDTTGEPNSYVVDFTGTTVRVTTSNKNTSNQIRCVRDIEGEALLPPYVWEDDKGYDHIVIDMTGIEPEETIRDDKYDILNASAQGADNLRGSNSMGRAFIVSRWYGTGSAVHPPRPTPQPNVGYGNGDSNLCAGYEEPGLEGRKWIHPSLEELRVIFRQVDVIENYMRTTWAGGPGATTYNNYERDVLHWTNTQGSNNPRSWALVLGDESFEEIDQQKNQATGLFRCILYIDTSDGGGDSPNIPPRS